MRENFIDNPKLILYTKFVEKGEKEYESKLTIQTIFKGS